MRRFLFWSLCFCLLFPVGLSSCDGSDSAAVIFGGTTGKLTWTLTEDGVLTITGEGPMPDYRDGGTSETPPWYPHVNRISSLTIGEGVTRIGDYAFMLCSFVTKVVIPESVTSMGDWAFWHCQSLKRITFPDRMVRFGEWAFYENESLQSVCIPEGVTTIPSSAFARCHNLTCVIMPGSLQTICGGAFSQCHKLTDVTIPDGVTVIETGAFRFNETMRAISKEYSKSKEEFILHFKRTYSEPYPPSWILGELLTIGNVNAIYRNIKQNRIRKRIAKRFGLPINVFESWLTVIAVTRNACGHHSRVWNKQNAIQPAIPNSPAGEWITQPTDSMRAYFDLCIIKYFLNVISPNNDMQSKLTWLFIRFPEIDLKALGFPQGWETEPLWR